MRNDKETEYASSVGKIRVIQDLTREDLIDFLESFMGGSINAFEWVDYDKKDYKRAKDDLATLGLPHDEDEEVWAEMLIEGGNIRLLEAETADDWLLTDGTKASERANHLFWRVEEKKPIGGKWHKLTLAKLLRGYALYFKGGLFNKCRNIESVFEDGDTTDIDGILQYALFGDIEIG